MIFQRWHRFDAVNFPARNTEANLASTSVEQKLLMMKGTGKELLQSMKTHLSFVCLSHGGFWVMRASCARVVSRLQWFGTKNKFVYRFDFNCGLICAKDVCDSERIRKLISDCAYALHCQVLGSVLLFFLGSWYC